MWRTRPHSTCARFAGINNRHPLPRDAFGPAEEPLVDFSHFKKVIRAAMNERLELADVLWGHRLRECLGQDRILEEAGFELEALMARGGLSIEANWGYGCGWGARAVGRDAGRAARASS